MLTPEQKKDSADYIVQLYQDLEAFIIRDFSRRVAAAGEITETAKWQAIRGIELGMAMNDIRSQIVKINALGDDTLENLIKEYATMALENEAFKYEYFGEIAPNLGKSAELQQYMIAIEDQTKGSMRNITGTLGVVTKGVMGTQFTDLTSYYQYTMDFAQFQVSTGVLDYNTAIRNAVKEMAASGIRTVEYASGKSTSIDVAARRNVMTAVGQVAEKINKQVIKDLNADYAEVTAHEGARPSHAKWQGRVYKIIGSEPDYPNLMEATGLGTAGGLLGPNCRHDYYAFFPEFDNPTWSEKELKNIDNPPFKYEGKIYNHYQATQKQRYYERSIRQTKNELIGYDAAGDKEAFVNASILLQRQRTAYTDFSIAAGLIEQQERAQVLGFDRSIAQKAVWAFKKNA